MGYYTQLYGPDAVACESMMLDVYSVFVDPPNFVCGETGIPKVDDLRLAFGRDGLHFHRPAYNNSLSPPRVCGKWDYGYLRPADGICTVVGDRIWFSYPAFSGKSPVFSAHKYSGRAIEIVKLEHDGFAAMKPQDEKGELVTEILKYQGEYVFIDAGCPKGELAVGVLDEGENVIPGYSVVDCATIAQDQAKYKIRWKTRDFLDLPRGKICLKFTLKNRELYSFWITDGTERKSHGYLVMGALELEHGDKDD